MFYKTLYPLIVLILSLPLSSVFSSSADPAGLGPAAQTFFGDATEASPHFVIYSDQWVSGETGPPDVSKITGFNVFALSFLLSSGPADQAEEWVAIGTAARRKIKAQYAAAGIKLIVSAFGSTDAPTSSGADAVSTANTMAAWVKQYDLDGIDVDYEDFNAINAGDGSAEAWLSTFTQQLRTQLPRGTYTLSHAPVAPWFSPNKFGGGGYLAVNKNVGDLIDWYNIQFYNQGTSEYTTCNGLLKASSNTWPESALFQIAANGVDINKLVIGKPATASDASNGFISPATLATCLGQAKAKGWNAGAMVWEFPDAAASWIATVRADSWPVGSSTTTTSETTRTSTTTKTSTTTVSTTSKRTTTTSKSTTVSTKTTTSTSAPSTPTSGACAGIAAWDYTKTYVGGDKVTYGGHLWTAKWWSEDDTPGGAADVWVDKGAC